MSACVRLFLSAPVCVCGCFSVCACLRLWVFFCLRLSASVGTASVSSCGDTPSAPFPLAPHVVLPTHDRTRTPQGPGAIQGPVLAGLRRQGPPFPWPLCIVRYTARVWPGYLTQYHPRVSTCGSRRGRSSLLLSCISFPIVVTMCRAPCQVLAGLRHKGSLFQLSVLVDDEDPQVPSNATIQHDIIQI